MRFQADLSLLGRFQGWSGPMAQLPSSIQLNAVSFPGRRRGCRGGSWKGGDGAAGAGEGSAGRGGEGGEAGRGLLSPES